MSRTLIFMNNYEEKKRKKADIKVLRCIFNSYLKQRGFELPTDRHMKRRKLKIITIIIIIIIIRGCIVTEEKEKENGELMKKKDRRKRCAFATTTHRFIVMLNYHNYIQIKNIPTTIRYLFLTNFKDVSLSRSFLNENYYFFISSKKKSNFLFFR
jgi:hypothetical protein